MRCERNADCASHVADFSLKAIQAVSLPERDGLDGGCWSRGTGRRRGGTGSVSTHRRQEVRPDLGALWQKNCTCDHDTRTTEPNRRAQTRCACLTSETKTLDPEVVRDGKTHFISEASARAVARGSEAQASSEEERFLPEPCLWGSRAPPFPLSPVGGGPVPRPGWPWGPL